MKKLFVSLSLVLSFYLFTVNLCSAQNLWGMTSSGGASGSGVIFEYNTSSSTYIDQYDFDGLDNGGSPQGSLLYVKDANHEYLYGMTQFGGQNSDGIIFRIEPNATPPKSSFNILINFDGTNGAAPYGSLILASDGNLYGMTQSGGTNINTFSSGAGVIFQYTPGASNINIIHDFDATLSINPPDGIQPFGSLIQASDGNLYGMTFYGGVNNNGVIFEYNLIRSTYTKLIDFSGSLTGPYGNLIQASDGNLYGISSGTGPEQSSNPYGILFRFNFTSSTLTIRKNFNAPPVEPYGSLLQASNGKLYGMFNDQLSTDQYLFEYNLTTNTYINKINFDEINVDISDGSLMQASDGNLYGMTYSGGTNSEGNIFLYVAGATSFTNLISFTGNTGSYPGASPEFSTLTEVCASSAPAISGPSVVCPGSAGNVYNANNMGGSTNFTWAVSSGGTITLGQGTNTVTVTWWNTPGTQKISVNYLGDGTLCGSAVSPLVYDVTVNSYPSINISTNTNPACSGTGVTFTAIPVNGGLTPSYQWKVNGTSVGTNSTVSTYTYTPSNGDIVTCVLTSNATCFTGYQATSNSITMIINSNLTASVNISADANDVCLGTEVTFTATPTNGGATPLYQWQVGGANASGISTNSVYSYKPSNNDEVTCILTSSLNCAIGSPVTSSTISMIMTTSGNVPVSVIIKANANNVCPGTTVTFTATPSNGGATPSYQWHVNGVNASGISTNSTYTYTPANSDAITCILTSSITCVTGSPATSNSITMIVNIPVVSVSIVASANPICSGTLTTVTATPINGGASPSYLWQSGALNLPGTNTISIYPTNNGIVTCILTSSISCATGNPATSNSITITVNTLPTITVTPNPNPANICSGNSASLTASGASTYTWSPSDGLSAITGTTVTANPTITTTYTVSGTDANVCENSNTVAVTVNQLPAANAGSPQSICQGSSATIGAATVGSDTYSWSSNPTGFTSSVAKPNVSPTITTTYTLTETIQTTGCQKTNSVVVTVNSYPTATITPASSTTFCTGGSVLLNVNSGTGLTYQWQNTSGNISGATTSTYLATAAGNYDIIVTQNSCSTTSSPTTITVNSYPLATITPVGSTTFCSGGSVVLNANTGIGLTYQWQNSNGNISGQTTSTYTAITADIYTLIVTQNSCSTTSSPTTVTVNSYPSATITPVGSTTFCTGGSVELNANTGSGLTYLWQNSSGNISGQTTSTYTAITADSYALIVTQNSCSTTSSPTTVTVNSYPSAIITPVGSTTFCTGGSVVLNASTGTGLTYQWQNSSGNISGQTTSTYTAITADSYALIVTQNSCSTTSSPITVTVNSYPSAIITPVGSTTFCTGGSVVLNANIGSGLTYQWQNGSGNISGQTTTTYIATTTDNYSVIVTQNSCTTTSSSVTVTVNPLPTAYVINNTPNCSGNPISIGGSAIPEDTYSWSSNPAGFSSTDANPSVSPTITTTYTLTETITATNCQNTNSVNITVNPLPEANAGNAQTFCYGSSTPASIGSTSTPFYSYSWSPTDGLSSTTISNPDANPSVTTTYTLTVTDDNGCQNTSSVVVTVGYTISGKVLYDNGTDNSIMATISCHITTVTLFNSGYTYPTTTTDAEGNYSFTCIPTGTYTVTCTTTDPFGGENPVDALVVERFYLDLIHSFGDDLKFKAALVNGNNENKPNTVDALSIERRYLNLINQFDKGLVPNWLFTNSNDDYSVITPLSSNIIVLNTDLINNIKAICTGDVNGSYKLPVCSGNGFHQEISINNFNRYNSQNLATMCNISIDSVKAKPGNIVEIPLRVQNFNSAAYGFKINYDSNTIIFDTIINVNSAFLIGSITHSCSHGVLGISWISTNEHSVNISNDKLFDLQFVYLGDTSSLAFNADCIVGDNSMNEVNVTYQNGYISPIYNISGKLLDGCGLRPIKHDTLVFKKVNGTIFTSIPPAVTDTFGNFTFNLNGLHIIDSTKYRISVLRGTGITDTIARTIPALSNLSPLSLQLNSNVEGQWVKTYGELDTLFAFASAIDLYENIYVSFTDLDNGIMSLIKYSPNGTMKWIFNYEDGYYNACDMKISKNCHIYLLGAGMSGNIILEFDSTGILLSSNSSLGNFGYSYVCNTSPTLMLDSLNNYYINANNFIAKFNSQGLLWSNSFGGGKMFLDNIGDVYVNQGTTSHKYSSNGTLLWTVISGGGNTFVDMKIDSSGNMYVMGSDGNYDGVISNYNKNGVLQWSYEFDNAILYSLNLDNSGHIYVTYFDLISWGYSILICNNNGEVIGQTDMDYENIIIFNCYMPITQIDNNGGIYFSSLVNDSGLHTSLIKYQSSNGSEQWEVNNASLNRGMIISPNNNIYLIGEQFPNGMYNGAMTTAKYSQCPESANLLRTIKNKPTTKKLVLSVKDPDVNLYPNPNDGSFTLEVNLPSDGNVTLEAYNVIGENVLSEQQSMSKGVNKLNLKLNSSNKGIYFFNIVTATKTFNKKVIIE